VEERDERGLVENGLLDLAIDPGALDGVRL
jgi:hypothetical protein